MKNNLKPEQDVPIAQKLFNNINKSASNANAEAGLQIGWKS